MRDLTARQKKILLAIGLQDGLYISREILESEFGLIDEGDLNTLAEKGFVNVSRVTIKANEQIVSSAMITDEGVNQLFDLI